ncbi:MAG TPA: hypothetical protein VG755_13980 [Nannocystaceae bacterium]|nr:hypothetical protein [Nannocystaceae bacterium]
MSPTWPLLATMLAGTWLGWTWFLLNGIGLNSDRKRAQYLLLFIGLVIAILMAVTLQTLLDHAVISSRVFEYLAILLVGWKLYIGYRLCDEQRLDHELFEYFGGKSFGGGSVVMAGTLLRGTLFAMLPPGWWILVLS